MDWCCPLVKSMSESVTGMFKVLFWIQSTLSLGTLFVLSLGLSRLAPFDTQQQHSMCLAGTLFKW